MTDAGRLEDRHGRLFGLLILLEDRLGGEEAQLVHPFIAAGECALALEEHHPASCVQPHHEGLLS